MRRGAREFVTFEASDDDGERRLDRVLRKFLKEHSLGTLYRALRTGAITVNGTKQEAGYRVCSGDRIAVDAALVAERPQAARRALEPLSPMRISRRIILENHNILILNKAPGELVHGPASLEEVVRGYLEPRIPASLSFVPGPLHRLDRNTSGLIAFGASAAGARQFTSLLRSRRIHKLYLALLEGELSSPVVWKDSATRDSASRRTVVAGEGREVTTMVTPAAVAAGRTFAVVEIPTGMTHQIRAQCAFHGFPLRGDRKYGSTYASSYLLHAAALSLEAPDPLLGFQTVTAPLPLPARREIERSFGPSAIDRALRLLDDHTIGRR